MYTLSNFNFRLIITFLQSPSKSLQQKHKDRCSGISVTAAPWEDEAGKAQIWGYK